MNKKRRLECRTLGKILEREKRKQHRKLRGIGKFSKCPGL
jgi:hypothetical protein